MVYVLFEDATVQILNLAEGQVANQSSGHSLPINSLVWADKLNFFSSSEEGCLYVWRYIGKGWNMQAMDISAGKGEITALAVHPSHRVLACGFTKGCIKIFQTGEKPKFLNTLSFENSEISYLEYSHCGNFLGVLYIGGYCILLNAKFEIVAELEQNRPRASLLLALHEIFSSQGVHLMSATIRETSSINLQAFQISKQFIEKIDEKALEIEGSCTGLKFHCSGAYVLASSNLGGIFIFNVSTGDLSGVILTEKSIIGCIIDPSGLYVGTFAESLAGVNTRFVLYEIGTGKKASELGRLDDVGLHSGKWHNDGKYLLIGGKNGILTVWRVPKVLVSNINDMLSSMQTNPYIWEEYTIDLPNKQIAGLKINKKVSEYIVLPDEKIRGIGAFANSVVALVKKPEKNRERAASKPKRVKNLDIPESNNIKSSRTSTPVSFYKDFKEKNSLNDFYFKPNFHTNKIKEKPKNKPVVVKSTLIGTSKSIESIDVECSAPNRNPAHKLYEKFDTNNSEYSDYRD